MTVYLFGTESLKHSSGTGSTIGVNQHGSFRADNTGARGNT